VPPTESPDGPTSDAASASDSSSNSTDGIAGSDPTNASARTDQSTNTDQPSNPDVAAGEVDDGTTPAVTEQRVDPDAPMASGATDATAEVSTSRTDPAASTSTGSDDAMDSTPSVSMLATPGDGSCGIGTYADSLLEGFDDVESERLHIDVDPSTISFLRLAIRTARAEGDILHVQHEYGLFGRHGSRYPGLFGVIFFPVLFLLTRLNGKRVVTTMHSVLRPSAQDTPLSIRLYLLLSHNLLGRVTDHVVFLSKDCQDRFLADVALEDDDHSLLPHGVSVEQAVEVSSAEAKACFDFDHETTVVMIPGFVRPPKGHDVFIDVAAEFLDCEFFIAGGARPEGDDFGFAEEIFESAPANVTATGVLDDEEFHVALQAADLAFLPYRVVTQSGTFNWCAAHELPVLASDETYFRQLRHRWGNLETVDVEDREAVIDHIETLLSSEERREQLSERMRAFKNANDFRHVAREHRYIYEYVCETHPVELDDTTDARTAGGDGGARTVGTVGSTTEEANAELGQVDATTVAAGDRAAARTNGGTGRRTNRERRARGFDDLEVTDGQWRAACSALRD
jgi:glycosyltransferase involved in cell wall biosynthesis